jgi:solute carrier family 25 iron transporter 28/37
MSGEDVYESLPDGSSVGVTLAAGAMAGIMEHCVMFPVDCVKTRMQALACDKPKFQSSSIVRNLLYIVKDEGLFRPIQGVQAMALGAGPAHAMYFTCYEYLKENLTPYTVNSYVPESLVHAVAGASATVLHDGIMTPAEVVKQRMQMCCSPYKSSLTCAKTIFATEGLGAFYRSYGTMLTMNIPFQATHFMVYEKMQVLTNPNREYNPQAHLVSGAAAGALAATITMPLDVCKTLLNTQEANVLTKLNATKVVGLWSAAGTVWRLAGPLGFFQGLRARVLYQMPSTAISWSVYEFFKYYFNKGTKDTSYPEDTLADLRSSMSAHPASRDGGGQENQGESSEGEKERFWDTIVTDLPRHVRVKQEVIAESLRRESSVNNSELVHERTFPNYRTEA